MTVKRNFTSEELLTRWEHRRELQNIMGKLTQSYLMMEEAEIYGRFWSKRADVCLGVNTGWYSGAEAVKGYYDALGAKIRLASDIIAKTFPEKLSGKTREELYGVGQLGVKPVDTFVIEIAGDGKTAKYIGYDCGLYCIGSPDGSADSNFTFAKVFADLKKEGNTWKIWHLLTTYDHIIPAGKNYSDLDPEAPWGADIVEQACGDPTIRDVAYDALYGWVDVWERLPRPYYTFDDSKAYTAEGKPACYKIGLYR